MKLADKDILEVHELCGALLDDRITDAQHERLSRWLDSSAEARTIYFHATSLSASIAEYACEMQADAPTLPVSRIIPFHRTRNFAVMTGALAVAACVTFGLFVFIRHSPIENRREELADSELQTGTFVARITGAKDCVWNSKAKFLPGDALQHGQQLDLAAGFAEITFDSGAQIILKGPATMEAVSAWEATLLDGDLKATVPPQAIGFRVHHKSVEVVDLGTEFSMVADAGGDAEVRVLKGAVEVSPAGEEEAVASVMHENESRSFGKARKNGRSDFAGRHLRLTKSAPLDRWSQRVNFAHWSFDEVKDGAFKAETVGMSGSFDATPVSSPLVNGRWQNALHLDGRSNLTASAPGLMKAASRAVVFWVRVPEDAQLSDSHAMVAWPMQSKKYGKHQLQIGWNHNPNQGPLGALRTELGKLYAVGAMPLRDGRWHHVAVVFQPVGAGDAPVQITQYVDGRLEGTIVRAIKVKHPAPEVDASAEMVWLGRAPGKHGKGFFRGDLDELFITDRALSQPEIVSLMTQNRLPRLELSASTNTGINLPANLSSTP